MDGNKVSKDNCNSTGNDWEMLINVTWNSISTNVHKEKDDDQ